MSQKIRLLPENVCNQIAAGEVVQRPASVVKELIENAIDAKASSIELHIREAGRSSIKVSDNGEGMNAEDLQLCIERHSTSKIEKAEDIFKILSMGFRGEAMASIASVAHMDIKSKEEKEELGNQLVVEGGKIHDLQPTVCKTGTIIEVKNLFFNIPARRNFLKSNAVETKHIFDAFQRLALSFEGIEFKLYNQGEEVFNLPANSFRQRIVSIFGKRYNERLVPVEESTDIVQLEGFVGKPEFAKRSRGEQYFFVNNRFIKSAYLHHAMTRAYEELLPKELHPSYFIKLTIDPDKIDINIHPTKTEIKFDDEKSIYAILRTTVRRALGKYNVTPTLDFEREMTFDVPSQKPVEVKIPEIKVNPDYNPFESGGSSKVQVPQTTNADNWQQLFEDHVSGTENDESSRQVVQSEWTDQEKIEAAQSFIQIKEQYIVTNVKSGLMMIDQQRAHQRILFEQILSELAGSGLGSQTLLHPAVVDVNQSEKHLFENLQESLLHCGIHYEVKEDQLEITSIPELYPAEEAESLVMNILEQHDFEDTQIKHRTVYEKIAMQLARTRAIKRGKKMSYEEMKNLVDQLFACEFPSALPNGAIVVQQFDISEIDERFART